LPPSLHLYLSPVTRRSRVFPDHHHFPLYPKPYPTPLTSTHPLAALAIFARRGKAGRHVIPYLISQGHKILNLDLIDFPDPTVPVYTLKCDLTDSGQVFNALTTLFDMGEYGKEDDPEERGNGGYLGTPGMVVHFGAYARVSTSERSEPQRVSERRGEGKRGRVGERGWKGAEGGERGESEEGEERDLG